MSEIKVYGADWCGDCRRAKAVLNEQNVSFEYIDLVAHPEKKEVAQEISGRSKIPVIVFPDGSFLSEPANEEIIRKL